MTLYAAEPQASDSSLTSLEWLTELRFPGATALRPSGFDNAAFPQAADTAELGSPLSQGKPAAAAFTAKKQTLELCLGDKKPPYTYAKLICMAMREGTETHIRLSDIYGWISGHFTYYKPDNDKWKKAIRFTLSTTPGFTRVPRLEGDPPKGGRWKVDPAYNERCLRGKVPNTRMP